METSEILLKNEVFKKWISLNDELRTSIFAKLNTMSKEERSAIIQKHTTTKSSFGNFCKEIASENIFETWQVETRKALTNLQVNNTFNNVSENALKYAIFRVGKNAKARTEDDDLDLRLAVCDTQYEGCEAGVAFMVLAMTIQQIPHETIEQARDSALMGCWILAVKCLSIG